MAEQQPLDTQLSRMSIREQLGSRFQSLRGLRSRDRTKSQDAPVGKEKPTSNNGPAVMSPRSRKGQHKDLTCFQRPLSLHQDALTLLFEAMHAAPESQSSLSAVMFQGSARSVSSAEQDAAISMHGAYLQ